MFVADVKCLQATWKTVPHSWADSAKALSPKLLCVRGTTHVIRARPKGSSVTFGDEMDAISQVDRHLTAQCLAHQTVRLMVHYRVK